MAFQIRLVKGLSKSLEKVNSQDRKRLNDAVAALSENQHPNGATKLKGTKQQVYRLRVGDYRVLYSIYFVNQIVIILDIGHRSEVYKEL